MTFLKKAMLTFNQRHKYKQEKHKGQPSSENEFAKGIKTEVVWLRGFGFSNTPKGESSSASC